MSGRLIDSSKLIRHLEDLRGKTEFGPEISRFNLATGIITNIEIEIESGRLDAQSPTPGQDGPIWWCPACNGEKDPRQVTFDETCVTCGTFIGNTDPPSPTSTGERE